MSGTSNTGAGGIGFVIPLTLLFIGLKLGRVISWSWWWVLSPIWISALISISVLLIFMVIMALAGAFPVSRTHRR